MLNSAKISLQSGDCCGVCKNKVTRKGAYCSGCSLQFHGYCVDAPIKPDSNWLCNSCSNSHLASIPRSDLESNNASVLEKNISFSELIQQVNLLQQKQDSFIKSCEFMDNMKAKHEEFAKSLSVFNSNCNIIMEMEDKVTKLEDKVEDLQNKCNYLSSRFHSIEHYSYLSNVEIRGIPYNKRENILKIFSDIYTALDFPIHNSDIKYIHRTKSNKDAKPIIVEFNSKFIKENFLIKVRSSTPLTLKNIGFKQDSQLFISEHLPPWKKKLLHESRVRLQGDRNFQFVWTRYGKIFCRKHSDSNTQLINEFEDLDRIISSESNNS